MNMAELSNLSHLSIVNAALRGSLRANEGATTATSALVAQPSHSVNRVPNTSSNTNVESAAPSTAPDASVAAREPPVPTRLNGVSSVSPETTTMSW